MSGIIEEFLSLLPIEVFGYDTYCLEISHVSKPVSPYNQKQRFIRKFIFYFSLLWNILFIEVLSAPSEAKPQTYSGFQLHGWA